MSTPLSADAIKAAVSSMLAQSVDIPNGHRAAIVTVTNQDRVEVAVATKVNDHWHVELKASHDWTGDNAIGVMSKLTW